MSCPFTQRPRGETRKATHSAMSCGVPRRPVGCIAVSCVRTGSVIHPVPTGPGLMTFEEMPRWASSLAAAMTMRSSAPLLAP